MFELEHEHDILKNILEMFRAAAMRGMYLYVSVRPRAELVGCCHRLASRFLSSK